MQYNKPKMECWDLDEDDIVVTSLNGEEKNEEGVEGGDFDGSQPGIDWGF